jgi:hypothetical protein
MLDVTLMEELPILLSACSSEDQIEQVTTVIRTMHKGMEAALPA